MIHVVLTAQHAGTCSRVACQVLCIWVTRSHITVICTSALAQSNRWRRCNNIRPSAALVCKWSGIACVRTTMCSKATCPVLVKHQQRVQPLHKSCLLRIHRLTATLAAEQSEYVSQTLLPGSLVGEICEMGSIRSDSLTCACPEVSQLDRDYQPFPPNNNNPFDHSRSVNDKPAGNHSRPSRAGRISEVCV